MNTGRPSSRSLIATALGAILIAGCAAPTTRTQNSTRTQTYPGPRRPAAETSSIFAAKKDLKGWYAVLVSVDGTEVDDGADVLPGAHTLNVYSLNLAEAAHEVAGAERELLASGKPTTVPNSAFQIGVTDPGEKTVMISALDPRMLKVADRQKRATQRTLRQTAEAGQSYIVYCDAADPTVRVKPAGQSPPQ